MATGSHHVSPKEVSMIIVRQYDTDDSCGPCESRLVAPSNEARDVWTTPFAWCALWIIAGAFTSSIYLWMKLVFSSDSFVGWIVLYFWSITEGEQWTRTCCRRPWRYFIFSLCYRTFFCYFFGFLLHFWRKKWGKHIFWDFCPYHLVLLCPCCSACPGTLTTNVNGGLEILFEIWELAPWTLGYISTRRGSVANKRNSRVEAKGLASTGVSLSHWL